MTTLFSVSFCLRRKGAAEWIIGKSDKYIRRYQAGERMWNCCAPQFTMTWCVVPSWRCSHRQQSIARIYIHIRGWEFAQFCFRRCSELHAIYIYANLRECVGRWNAIWYVILVLSLTASLVFVSYGISEGEGDRQNLIIKFYAFANDDDAHTVLLIFWFFPCAFSHLYSSSSKAT